MEISTAKKYELTFPVGKYKCEMAFARGVLSAKWSPDVPSPGLLNKRAMAEYRVGRDHLLAMIARDLDGGAIMVVE